MSYRDFEIKTENPDSSITCIFPTRGLKALRESPFLGNLVKCAKALLEDETTKTIKNFEAALAECQFQQVFLVGASMTEAWKLVDENLVLNAIYKGDSSAKSMLDKTIDSAVLCARTLNEPLTKRPLATFAALAIKLTNSLDELYYLV